ncbi:50S ribosomal protein L32 [Calorimonas adulescens]|uniref:Large ribosomal subunit protein bL32 n=1 Tax=Calorimonas adulescens TaxID=2606906 RepID=A0A5D8QFV8_9THEO|nr:50S ribosomal protein L32 [Calorimonas adulescens]TZE83391.1 50S ribosomal protein L32 [Calorimonas adulescens]
MGVPKRRWSKARTRSRRAHWKLSGPTLVECPQCHELMMPHRVCKNCGFYDGKKVIVNE